jgi:hypothetical protein
MKYQLWNQDEYGTTAIIGTFQKHDEAVSKAKSLVTNANFSNSLSSLEQMRNVEAYFVEFKNNGKISDKTIYAGNRRGGKFWQFKVGDNSIESFNPSQSDVAIFIGNKTVMQNGKNAEKSIYLQNDKKNDINRVNDSILAGKSIYFIVPIE